MYNANNYGYNPYGTYMPQRPMQQPIQQPQQIIPVQQNNLNGKQVDSIDVVRATDIPMDGSISYFPLADGSAVITKQLQMDGTSKITIYKPMEEKTKDMPKYITKDDLEDVLDDYGINTLEDIKDDIDALKKEIKDMQKKKVKNE